MQIIENAPLKQLNSFGVSASARYLVTLESPDDIQQVLSDPRWRELPSLFLGGGSNLLFRNNFPGVIIHPAYTQITELGAENDAVFFKVDAGHSWHALVLETIKRGYSGLENLSLIPGTVGAAPIQNIGAYGVELKSCFHQLDAVDMRSGENRSFDLSAAEFGYRDSYFKRNPGQHLIQSVTLKLPIEPDWHLDYGGIREELAQQSDTEIDAKSISDAVCRIRQRKLPDPAKMGNAGSFFKNPIVPGQQADQLKADYPAIPVFQHGLLHSKLSAAWLIDQCGWKGYRDRDAGVSEQHALVLVNHGSATGDALFELAQKIQASVEDRFGIKLEPEPRII